MEDKLYQKKKVKNKQKNPPCHVDKLFIRIKLLNLAENFHSSFGKDYAKEKKIVREF